MANEPKTSGFTICCGSCAAKLKVTKPSLVGQMLACPKCGEMLQITAPVLDEPPTDISAKSPAKSVSQTVGRPRTAQHPDLKTTLTTSDFDEIEQLLIKNPQLNEPAVRTDLEKFKPAAKAGSKTASKAPQKSGSPRSTADANSATNQHRQAGGAAASRTANPIEVSPSASGSQPVILTGSSPASAPLLPSDRWSSAAVQKRRRMMNLLAVGIGLILVLLTVVFFVVNGSKSPPDQVAQVTDPIDDQEGTGVDAHQPDASEPEKTPPTETDSSDENGSAPKAPNNADIAAIPSAISNGNANAAANEGRPGDDNSEVNTEPQTGDNQSPLEANSELNLDQPPPMVDPLDEPPPILPTDSDSSANSSPPGTDADKSSTVSPNSEAPSVDSGDPPPLPELKPDVSSSVQPDDLKGSLTNLDRLSQMVEGSQLSINRFRDLAASAREEQIVGLPKYFIEKDDPLPVDAALQLAIPISHLKYDSAPLSTVARDLMSITGVPMTIDVESVIARHGHPNPQVKLDVTGVDFGQAIDTMLQSAELVKLQPDQGRGLIFAAANRDERSEKKFDLPKFDAVSDEERKASLDELSLMIQGLIAPETWKLEENPARLSVENSTLSVIHSPQVHFQARNLLDKVNGLLELNQAKPNAEGSPNALLTKSGRMVSKLELPSGLQHRFSESLVDLLDTLSTETKVDVLADWEALAVLGWGPLTRMPGTLTGSTLRDTLQELSQALGVTYVIIDDKTVLLTSFEAAVQRTNLEVYSFRKLLKGKVNADQALLILNQTLAAELKNPLIRTYYSPRLQGLFVVAPQILQEKIERVLRGLEEL